MKHTLWIGCYELRKCYVILWLKWRSRDKETKCSGRYLTTLMKVLWSRGNKLWNKFRNFQEGVSKWDGTSNSNCKGKGFVEGNPTLLYVGALNLVDFNYGEAENESTVEQVVVQWLHTHFMQCNLKQTNRERKNESISWTLWLHPFSGAFHKICQNLAE